MEKLFLEGKLAQGPYGCPTGGWMFVYPTKGGYELLQDFLTCKDYIHEGIGSKINKKPINTVVENYDKIVLDKLLMAFSFDKSRYPDIKRRIFLTMAFIQRTEAFEGRELTVFKELKHGYRSDVAVFLIDGSKMYMESPVLLHWMVATLRTMPYSKSLMDKDFDFDRIYRSIDNGDATILKFMYKHDIASKLMRHHNDLVRPLGFKKIYPQKVDQGSYHSNFGIWSACTNTLGSPGYRRVINKIFKEEEIPYYKRR